MKRIVFFIILCTVGISQLHGQEIKKNDNPDEQTIVNKKFDENGNLIQYDSTYVHQWSSDSTYNFNFDENFALGNEFPDISNLMKEFFGDSAVSTFGFPNHFQFSPFDDEDFFKQFGEAFSDSILTQRFNWNNDSLFNQHFDFKNHFPENFSFPELEELQKQFQQYNFPEFKSKEQQDDWEKLMQKHKKEKEELMKKWEEK